MNKIIFIAAITMALALTASAEKKHHSSHNSHHSSHNSHNSHHSSHNSHHSNHNSHYSSGGYYTYVTKKIWVAGCSTRVWIAPRYEYRRQRCGTVIRVCVSNGYYDTRQSRGHYDYRQVKVYHSGHSSHHRSSGLSVSWRF